eukprot:TRINITY_DN31142_c0_g1_i7.p1 TRINITY_DN31142_c0_g1~~TRINITY_DN31142_c0_g1_i7.p1  ORF type:complete len:214 (+),score=18.51 TRINITY_DN31142_c0_g1_i7:35-643(+)
MFTLSFVFFSVFLSFTMGANYQLKGHCDCRCTHHRMERNIIYGDCSSGWCYVDPDYSSACGDLQKLEHSGRIWSRQACLTDKEECPVKPTTTEESTIFEPTMYMTTSEEPTSPETVTPEITVEEGPTKFQCYFVDQVPSYPSRMDKPHIRDADGCRKECNALPSCTFWKFIQHPGTCSLYLQTFQHHPGAISGYPFCGSGCP